MNKVTDERALSPHQVVGQTLMNELHCAGAWPSSSCTSAWPWSGCWSISSTSWGRCCLSSWTWRVRSVQSGGFLYSLSPPRWSWMQWHRCRQCMVESTAKCARRSNLWVNKMWSLISRVHLLTMFSYRDNQGEKIHSACFMISLVVAMPCLLKPLSTVFYILPLWKDRSNINKIK